MARETWKVKNTTNKQIGIGDLMFAPVIEPGKSIDLLRFHSYSQIEQSTDLANLLRRGWLVCTKSKNPSVPILDRVEVDEMNAQDSVISSAVTALDDKVDSIDFTTLLDSPISYSGESNKVVSVRPDELGLTFTEVTSGAPTGLNDIPDVTISSPINNQRIVYDSNTGQWVNRANPEQITRVSSTPFNLTEDSGVYIVDTSGGNIVVNIPAVTQFNDGERVRVYKSTSDLNNVTVQVTGQSQNIGNATTQLISDIDTGFSVIADYNGGSGTKWQIVQDSRAGDPPDLTTTTQTASSYNVASGVEVVLADASSNAITVNLPAAVDHAGRCIFIKKIDSSGNIVTIDADGSETIDGDLTKIITQQYTTMKIVCNGSSWFIL